MRARRRRAARASSPATPRRSSSTATSTSPTSARSAARSAASARAGARPTPTTSARRTSRRGSHEAVDFGATEICMQGGIHPDYTLEDYGRWLRLAKEVAPQLHLHAYSPMEVHYMCERSGKQPGGGVRVPASSAASARRPGPRPRCSTTASAQRISPNKLPVDALGRDHRGLPPHRPALDLDRDVRPHRGAVGARRAHAGRPRAAGAHRRDHRVRAAQLHPVPHAARAHPRDRGDLARGEPQAHRGLPAGARARRSRTCRRAG